MAVAVEQAVGLNRVAADTLVAGARCAVFVRLAHAVQGSALRNIQVFRQLAVVGRFGQLHQRCHLSAQLGFPLVRVLPAQHLVLTRIGLDLRPIQAFRPQLEHTQLPRHHQNLNLNLNKESFQLLQKRWRNVQILS